MSLDVCRICLDRNPDYIDIFGDEGDQKNVKDIVEQHLWFQIEQEDGKSNQICLICWQQIEIFHDFYTKIKNIHNALIPESSFETHFVKLEIDVGNYSTTEFKTEIDEISDLLYQPAVVNNDTESESSDNDEDDDDVPDYGSNESESESIDSDNEELPKPKKRQTRSKKIVTEEGPDSKQIDSDEVKEDQVKLTKPKKKKTNKESNAKELKREQSETENKLILEYFTMQCVECSEKFEDFTSFVRHFHQVHNKRIFLTCCGKKLWKRYQVLQHIQLHIDPEAFKCKICNKILKDQQGLDRHTLNAHSDQQPNFQCDMCPKNYNTIQRLEEHKVTHSERTFFCEDCGKGFHSNARLNNHKRIQHEGTNRFICEICARPFKSKLMFEEHRNTVHNTSTKVQCPQCGIWLKHQRGLKRHKATHDKNDEIQVCNICGKQSANSSAHKKHISYMHTMERTHVCEICNKAFKRPFTLREHMTTHTGEILYKCEFCPKTFNSSANMSGHRKKIHPVEWAEKTTDSTKSVPLDLLPVKSRRAYEKRYDQLMNWCEENEIELVNENALVDYFTELSKNLKYSSLWAVYCMLRSTLNFRDNIDITHYNKLLAFLKQQASGYIVSTSKTFRKEDIQKFLLEAPDDIYLLKKVVLIIGVFGACNRTELVNLTIDDIEDYETMLLIKLPSTESNVQRNITICNDEYIGLDLVKLYRKYVALRPTETTTRKFFLRYGKGVCLDQVVGLNTMGKIPSDVANYLNLSSPASYTGHCYRKSFESLQKNARSESLARKRHGMSVKLTIPAEGNVDNPNEDEINDGHEFSMEIENESMNYAKTVDMTSDIPSENRGIKEAIKNVSLDLLPQQSRRRYANRYKHYTDWCVENNKEVSSENALMDYFTILSKDHKSPSLWSIYSMLRSTLIFRHNINISHYSILLEYLKKQASGYLVNTSKPFTKQDIHKFLLEAPDEIYLLKKVVLMIGVFGACRCEELVQLTIDDVEDYETMLIIKLLNTELNTQRTFTICNDDYNGWDLMALYKKYVALRPKTAHTRKLFLSYANGMCINQGVGRITIGKIPSEVATYLKLTDPASYTGHCYRKSSASLRANSRCDISTLKRHGMKKSSSLVEGSIKDTSEKDIVVEFNSSTTDSPMNLKTFDTEHEPEEIPSFDALLEENMEATKRVPLNLLPERTRNTYEKRYKHYKEWCLENKIEMSTENALTEYFKILSKDHKSSSMWSIYSMLRSTINFRDNIEINQYQMLGAFLKKQSRGFRATPFKTLRTEDIQKFLLEAPNDIHLFRKVVLIIGISGACRCEELVKITIDDIEYYETMVKITIQGTKSNKQRTFTICDDDNNWNFMALYRKYVSLRPKAVSTRRFFLRYTKGVCINQGVGTNSIGKVPSGVAKYLKLSDPTLYTGHSFRKSFAPP